MAVPLDQPVTKPYKAALAALALFIGTMWANLNGRTDLGTMTLVDWLTVIVPTVVGTFGVYQTTNPPAHSPGV